MRKRIEKVACPLFRGFTLIELLVVVMIIAILASVVGVRVAGRTEHAKRAAAEAQLANFKLALNLYRLDIGDYPTTEEGLEALVKAPAGVENWKEPYLEKREIPLDPWRNKWVYHSPGTNNPESYDLISYGKDGLEGGEGANEDIKNW